MVKPLNSYKKAQIIIVDETLKVASFDFVSGDYFKNQNWYPYTKHDYAVFNATHTWVEFINRLLGVIAGLSILALFIVSLENKKRYFSDIYIILDNCGNGILGMVR